MFQKGRRLFASGSIGLLVVAGLHSIGHFSPPPKDAAWPPLEAAMRAYRIPMGSWSPSLYDIFDSLSLTMSVTLIVLGAIGLIAARGAETGLVRRLAVPYAIGLAALTALYGALRIPPPFVTIGIVALLFVLAATLPQRTTP